MAILYVITNTNPDNVEFFPPSVAESAWHQSIVEYVLDKALTDTIFDYVIGPLHDKQIGFFFKTEEEYNNFKESYTLIDDTLKADIETWKLAHSVTYEAKVYNITEISSTDPLF